MEEVANKEILLKSLKRKKVDKILKRMLPRHVSALAFTPILCRDPALKWNYGWKK